MGTGTDRSHFERFEAYHASFYRAVEATSVTPFAPRALDRALPAIVVSLGRHLRPLLTPPKGAIEIVKERTHLDSMLEILSKRVRAHRTLNPNEEAKVIASLRARAQDLLDSWFKVGKAHRDAGARLVYQPFENTDGPPLLHTPLDPALATLSRDARKFKAPRSLRDVEPSVNLWLKRLDGTEVELPAQGDEE